MKFDKFILLEIIPPVDIMQLNLGETKHQEPNALLRFYGAFEFNSGWKNSLRLEREREREMTYS